MKTLWLLTIAGTLAVPAPLAFPTMASADSSNSGRYIPSFCKDVTSDPSNPPGVNVGRCVSVEETSWQNELHGSEGWAAHQCWLTETFAPDVFNLLFDSFADCVQTDHDRLKQLTGG